MGKTMAIDQRVDLSGDDLKAQRFKMLEDIAAELSGEVVFPTCFDVAMRIRKALQDPDIPLARVAAQISMEPLIDAKLLRLANSVVYNPSGVEVKDLTGAIKRLGLNVVRNTAMAITMSQMLRSRDMANFDDIAKRLWGHTLQVASAGSVIARRLTRINPDEALLAGLVHDLGAFYMLYRATQYRELRERPETLKYLITQWHESIGLSVLASLGMPEDIIEATRDHDVLRLPPESPKNLKDVVYISNLMAGGLFEWAHQEIDREEIKRCMPGESYSGLKAEIQAHTAEMLAVFG